MCRRRLRAWARRPSPARGLLARGHRQVVVVLRGGGGGGGGGGVRARFGAGVVCVRGAPGTAGPSCGLVRGVMSPLMTCPIDPMASSAASAEPEPCRRWWSRGGSPPPPQPPAAGSICSAPILRNVEAPVRCAWATPSCWLLHCLSWLQIQAGRRCGRPACRRHAQDERVLRRLPLHEGRHGRAHMHGYGTNIHCRRGISTKFLSCKSLSITNGNA